MDLIGLDMIIGLWIFMPAYIDTATAVNLALECGCVLWTEQEIYEARMKDLFDGACKAEELFSLDELEEYAAQVNR